MNLSVGGMNLSVLTASGGGYILETFYCNIGGVLSFPVFIGIDRFLVLINLPINKDVFSTSGILWDSIWKVSSLHKQGAIEVTFKGLAHFFPQHYNSCFQIGHPFCNTPHLVNYD